MIVDLEKDIITNPLNVIFDIAYHHSAIEVFDANDLVVCDAMKKIHQVKFLFIFVVCGLMLPLTVLAQMERDFPQDSVLGNLNGASFPQFNINGRLMIMGVAGQVRDTDNQIVLPNAVYKPGAIRYQLDVTGYLHRIWYLTPEEAKGAKETKK